ncbi:hypothetical protein F383_31488 [Gossypium arboreum]|uniref:Uncharacterized protein n=1 Tax=Gossypium arboreum TaxID=29729 RepID=A0A0B0MXK5_GOSAR|nr:hypothetical protein F383_31488 [Gossypium arboreum]
MRHVSVRPCLGHASATRHVSVRPCMGHDIDMDTQELV